MQEQTNTLLPDLRKRLAVLKEELEREREAVHEIEACDQEELKALREAITEQG